MKSTVNSAPKDGMFVQRSTAPSPILCHNTQNDPRDLSCLWIAILPVQNSFQDNSFGVDSKLPQSLKCPVLQLDLTKPDHFQLVHEYVQNPACCYCHFAPPCGTASRARLIQRRNQRNPPIVRTDQHPDGLPHLGTLAMRVQSIFRTNEPPTSLHSYISSRNFGASKIQAGPSCGKPKPFLL